MQENWLIPQHKTLSHLNNGSEVTPYSMSRRVKMYNTLFQLMCKYTHEYNRHDLNACLHLEMMPYPFLKWDEIKWNLVLGLTLGVLI